MYYKLQILLITIDLHKYMIQNIENVKKHYSSNKLVENLKFLNQRK